MKDCFFTKLTFFCLCISIGSLVSCSVNIKEEISKANPRLMPSFICEGDPLPVAAKWDFTGTKGKIEIRTRTRKLGGPVGLRHEIMIFSPPPLTRSDKLTLNVFKKGDLVDDRGIDYTVLSGPVDVEFIGRLVEFAESKNEEIIYEEVPVFVRCTDSPNGEPANTEEECSDRLDDMGRPILDSDGNPEQDCVCPNEGGFLRMETRSYTVQIPVKQAILWEVDPSLFGDKVITKAYIYQQGEVRLTISGPGMSGESLRNVGSGGIGNNDGPGGIWMGTPQDGEVITTISGSEDDYGNPETIGTFILKLTISCADL